MFACTNRKKDARERFWPAVDERSISGKLHHQSRFRVDRVNPAAAKQTLKYIWRSPGRSQRVFGGRYRDFRVFLAAAMLTLESFWGRVFLACYTGHIRGIGFV
ncbi:hypothetical protein PoB_005248600 [Plakobranchus ocellatus]|uniref:Uncharacterized protein n=1 Tax=Plakobranchus ocellatus TaxID=259542 RepID=A0AAV4C3L0_9GAST|nr:hypothetical protein PoB_005248600 [Plakobranchus ocellatus]